LLLDLGKGVLDDATVRTACYVLGGSSQIVSCARIGNIEEREIRTQEIINALNACLSDEDLFVRNLDFFGNLPGSAIAYWIPDRLAMSLPELPPLADYVDIRQGIATGDNFRFLRMLCELPEGKQGYQSYSKGGEPVPFISDETLYVRSAQDAVEMKANAAQQYGSASRTIKNEDTFGKSGITYSQVNDACLKFRVHPGDSLYDMKGPVLFSQSETPVKAILGFLNSSAVEDFMRMMTDGRQWHVSSLKKIPVPQLNNSNLTDLSDISDLACKWSRRRFATDETSHFFFLDTSSKSDQEPGNLDGIQDEIDSTVWAAYGATEAEIFSLSRQRMLFIERAAQQITEEEVPANFQIAISIGCILGRWDIRYATGERLPPELPDPFDRLPICPPGMLQNADGLPAQPKDVPADYPLRISWPGILVDDENHPEDIVARVEDALKVIWKDQWEAIEQEACEILGVKTLREYFGKPAKFFADHLNRYSKSKRKAPIYWPLSTKSSSYTLWLYYHRLTNQTLHTCLADFLDPKIRKIQSELDAALAGSSSKAAELREFLDELKDLHDEIERIIKLPWKPNLNDGVLITASPLWKLFRLPKWQKDLKACWDKLSKGEFDWAHLAHSIWPQRVEKACEKDRSIAIAHGLEHLCKIEPPKPKKKSAKSKAKEEDPELIEED
jgi:hypothetical protein